jgi:hypothetical protein
MVDKPDTDERLAQLDREWRCKYEELQCELEETRELYKTEIRREAETFNRLVGLKNRAHELANMLWAAIKTIQDEDTRKKVKSAVIAGLDRMEASDQQRRQGRARP